MTASTQSIRALGHHSYVARSLSDGSALSHPWPGMSGRAALIARSLAVALVSTWLAFVSPHLLVLLAFALPFWIATEFEIIEARRQRVSLPKAFRISFVSRF